MQQDAAYSQEAEDQARQWIEQITDEGLGPDFFSGLKDGSHLCRLQQNDCMFAPDFGFAVHIYTNTRLLNKLRPGLVASKYETPNTQPFKQVSLAMLVMVYNILHCPVQLETIGKFLDGCRAYGLSEKDLFVTLDLHEMCNRNMV